MSPKLLTGPVGEDGILLDVTKGGAVDGLGFQTLKQPRMVPNDITLIQSTSNGY